jgi:hypothetical protein
MEYMMFEEMIEAEGVAGTCLFLPPKKAPTFVSVVWNFTKGF